MMRNYQKANRSGARAWWGAFALFICSATSYAYNLNQLNTHVTVSPPVGTGLARVTLPIEAVLASRHSGGADIAVFNSKGEPVPFSVIAAEPIASKAAPAQVALIPINIARADQAKRRASDEVISETSLDGVLIERVRGQAALRVSVSGRATGAAATPKASERVWTFAVLGEPEIIDFLVFDVAENVTDFAMPVRIETSADLGSWSLAAEGTVYRLNVADTVRQSMRIAGNNKPARFVRVTGNANTAIEREALRGLLIEHPASSGVRVPTEMVTMTLKAGSAANEWTVDLGGALSLTGVQVNLPQPNTVAAVQWFGRANASEPWATLAQETAYRLLTKDAEIRNPEFALRNPRVRELRLVVDGRGGGLGDGAGVSVRFQPLEVLFAARGAGPFTIGVGLNADKVSPEALPVATLVPGWSDKTRARIAPVSVDTIKANAAPATIAPKINWRTILLWGVLGLGVLMAALMAYKLTRPKRLKERVPLTSQPDPRELHTTSRLRRE
jgi:hypothetical protein